MSSDNYCGDFNDGGLLDFDDWIFYVLYLMYEVICEWVEDGEEYDQEYYDEILREEMVEYEWFYVFGDVEGFELEVVLE